jgi:putative hydrolase of the HAD superfamily
MAREPMQRGELARIEWVFFDAGETLVSPRPSFGKAIVQICREAGVFLDEDRAEEVADRCFKEFLDLLARFDEDRLFSTSPEKSRRFWTRYYTEFLLRMGMHQKVARDLSNHLYDELSNFERYGVFEDVEPVLERLDDAGLQMGVISNWEPWLDELLDYLGIGRFLRVRVISGKEGVEKPDPAMYRRALLRAQTLPEVSLHVGDDPRADGEPASGLGMSFVLVDRRGRHQETRWPKISSLLQLPEFLQIDYDYQKAQESIVPDSAPGEVEHSARAGGSEAATFPDGKG